ncbi:MAG: peptidoglycan DD-metalloendopeptidase family protein, partial [Coriobacteriia bacterium]|nr:peptidoglycan DD-metalloendopeptidase family protein [Coriobacteriia bacterium]
RAEVASLRADIGAKEAAITATQAEFDRQKALLEARITSSYKQGDFFYLELLLGAKDFRDLIARTTLVQRVIESNNDIALGLAATKDNLETAKSELDRNLSTVSAKRAEAETVEKNLREMRGARQAVANQQRAVQNQKNAMMEAAENDAARMKALAEEEEREAARIASAMRASQGGGIYNGVMAWPVPGGSLSSAYGWRIHPIFGTRKFHHGIDISAGSGADVVAAGDGTVIKTSYGWNGGYGNVVWVDHGDGVVSTYNHLLDGGILVSNGLAVVKGQHIAEMGSTGIRPVRTSTSRCACGTAASTRARTR